MTQPLPSETLEYERYVDGLRQSHGRLLTALQYMVSWAERHGLTKADLISGGQAEVPVIAIARESIAQAEALGATPLGNHAIAIHLEGGLVQDVTGIPPGCEVHVHDHDVGGGEKGYQFGGREGAMCGVTLWPPLGRRKGKKLTASPFRPDCPRF